MSPGRASWGPPLAVAAAGVLVVALVGGLATDIGPWYRGLIKPSFQPPDWVFGPVWTVIFALTAVAAADLWRSADHPSDRRRIVAAFAINGVLNVLWSVFFFAMRRPDWALAEVVLLWLSIALLIRIALPISSRAALLLAPYLVWVTFAFALNLAIVVLNGPF